MLKAFVAAWRSKSDRFDLLYMFNHSFSSTRSVNVFYRVNQERPDPQTEHDTERTKQEREFKIGSIGFADSLGILCASLLAVPTEVELCRTQVRRGKVLCQGL